MDAVLSKTPELIRHGANTFVQLRGRVFHILGNNIRIVNDRLVLCCVEFLDRVSKTVIERRKLNLEAINVQMQSPQFAYKHLIAIHLRFFVFEVRKADPLVPAKDRSIKTIINGCEDLIVIFVPSLQLCVESIEALLA